MAMEAAQPIIKVAAICGSLRKGSFNRGLIRSAVQLCNESIHGMQIDHVDIDGLPFLNTDLEVNGTYPAAVEAFRSRIREADSILFASPEYNYSFTDLSFPELYRGIIASRPLKNAIDWASRPPNVWADKPAAIMSAGGGFGGRAITVPSASGRSFPRSAFHQQARIICSSIPTTTKI